MDPRDPSASKETGIQGRGKLTAIVGNFAKKETTATLPGLGNAGGRLVWFGLVGGERV